LGTEWTAWNNEVGGVALRITGLNHDSAFFAILMVIGFCLTDSVMWKMIFFASCALSLSRVGIVTIIFVGICIIMEKVIKLNVDKGISYKSSLKWFIGIALSIVIVALIFMKSPIMRYQINYFIKRLSAVNSSKRDVGTTRHLMYIPAAFIAWFEDKSIIHKIIGVGPRVSGAVLAYNNHVNNLLTLSGYMLKNAWAIECDVAELLLGSGIVGLCMYYYILFRMYRYNMHNKTGFKYVAIGLGVFGIMYNVSMSTIVNLIFIIAFVN
jgi:hypothetical protein